MHLQVPTLKRANVQGKEFCLKKEVFAEVGWRTVMQKIWLKLLLSDEDRTGRVTTTKPYRNKAVYHWACFKDSKLEAKPQLQSQCFQEDERRGLA